jgi:hypothetical protein
MMCFGVEHKKTQIIYVVLHNLVDLEVRSAEIYLQKPYLSSRIARWQVLLVEYNIVFMTKKAMKENVIANHLVDHAVKDYRPLNFDLPDEDMLLIENDSKESDWWILYFDVAVNISGNGARVIIISP